MSTVVFEKLPDMNYISGCVALPKNYGTDEWEALPEVKAIRTAVFSLLETMEQEEALVSKIQGKPVVIKPNLVIVYSNIGTIEPEFPETTDPRVIDALVLWLKSYTDTIIIAESSGRGSPTRASFAISGLDRLAEHRGCQLVVLEERPCELYHLPKARVSRTLYIPDTFGMVARGEAFYISVPKLKTNLYTGVTLGFKNSMGIIPYNERQHAHHYDINRKLVEMMYLVKPDLTLVDGVVGGNGPCPAPVDPVSSNVLIAGSNPVETDRAAVRFMGFDPKAIQLIKIADELGFQDDKVRIIGEMPPINGFSNPDYSLLSDRIQRHFPGIQILYGIEKHGIDNPDSSSLDIRAIEARCRGGCVATTRFAFEMLIAEGESSPKQGTIIIGGGIDGYWRDRTGKKYSAEDIAALKGRTLCIGSCAKSISSLCDQYVAGCMPLANAPHAALHKLTGTRCAILWFKNRHFLLFIKALLETRHARRKLLKAGALLDMEFPVTDSAAFTAEKPEVFDASAVASKPVRAQEPVYATDVESKAEPSVPETWEALPIPSQKDPKIVQHQLRFEDDSLLASLTGIFIPNRIPKALFRIQAVLTTIITLSPFFAGILVLFGLFPGLKPAMLFSIFISILILHSFEVPFAIAAEAKRRRRKGLAHIPPSGKDALTVMLKTLLFGYPIWLPELLGIHDDDEAFGC